MCVQFDTSCLSNSALSTEDMNTLIEEKEIKKTVAVHLNPKREAVEGRSKQRGSQILESPRSPPSREKSAGGMSETMPEARMRRVVVARETQTSKIWQRYCRWRFHTELNQFDEDSGWRWLRRC